jgi:hypothetical protein
MKCLFLDQDPALSCLHTSKEDANTNSLIFFFFGGHFRLPGSLSGTKKLFEWIRINSGLIPDPQLCWLFYQFNEILLQNSKKFDNLIYTKCVPNFSNPYRIPVYLYIKNYLFCLIAITVKILYIILYCNCNILLCLYNISFCLAACRRADRLRGQQLLLPPRLQREHHVRVLCRPSRPTP